MGTRSASNQTSWSLLALAAAATVAAVWAPWADPSAGPDATPGEPEAEVAAWTPVGTRAVYGLDYRGWTKVTFTAANAVEGELVLRGELALEARSGPRGATWLALELTELDQATLTIAGRAAFGTPEEARAALIGPQALLELDGSGTVERVHVPADAPRLFQHVATLLAGDLVISRRPRTATRTTPRGVARFRTAVGSTGRIDRELLGYDALHGLSLGDAELAADGRATMTPGPGWPSDVTIDETLSATGRYQAKTSARLILQRSEQARRLAVDLQGTRSRGFAPVPAPKAHRSLVAKRAEALKGAQLLADIERYGRAGAGPDHARWLWTAAARLRTEPELASKLGALARDPKQPRAARELALDLLAGVGHPQAQAALREILSDPALIGTGLRREWLQRLGWLKAPDAGTVELVTAELERPRGPEDAAAAALAAGAVAHHAGEAGDHIVDGLLARLEATPAQDVGARVSLVRGLGNASAPRAVPALVSMASDGDHRTRRAVARALRGTTTDEARATLTHLASDPATGVQREALRALRGQDVDGATLATLGRAIADHELAESSLMAALDLVPTADATPEERLRFLEDLDARVKRFPDLRRRLSRLRMKLRAM